MTYIFREEVLAYVFREVVINMQKLRLAYRVLNSKQKNFNFEKSQTCEGLFPYFDN